MIDDTSINNLLAELDNITRDFPRMVVDSPAQRAARTIRELLGQLRTYERGVSRNEGSWRGIAAAMGYEPEAHMNVRPTSKWILHRVEMYRQQAAEEYVAPVREELENVREELRVLRAERDAMQARVDGMRAVAKVRVTSGGYAMSLAEYVAYALPEGDHWLYADKPEPTPGPDLVLVRADIIPMILTCPSCGERHIDEGEFATKPHHTHACQSCGMVWRPAKVNTAGVQFLPGYKNDDALKQAKEQG